MLRYFLRSRRLRLVVVTACLPYVLMALLVESLHGVQPSDVVGHASVEQTVSFVAARSATPAGTRYACPVCAWLRVGTRQVQSTNLLEIGDAVHMFVPLPITNWPESSVPRSTAFRGPPSPA